MHTRLRRGVIAEIDDRLSGRRRQAEFLRRGAERPPRLLDILERRLPLQIDRDAECVSVDHGNPVALGRNGKLGRRDRAAADLPQDLPRLDLELLLFAGNPGNHVVQDLVAGDAGQAGAGYRLQGDHRDAFEPEGGGQRLERQHQPDRRAVRVGDDAVRQVGAVPGRRQQCEVVRIHLGHEQRDVFVHAVGAGVRYDQAATGELGLDVSGHAGVQGREHDVELLVLQLVDRVDGHRRDGFVDRPGLNPGDRVAVGLPRGSLGGGQRGQLEPRVPLEQRDEPLAHGAGRTENGGAEGFASSRHGEAPLSAQARRMSAKTPPAVRSVPAPGPWTTRGRSR